MYFGNFFSRKYSLTQSDAFWQPIFNQHKFVGCHYVIAYMRIYEPIELLRDALSRRLMKNHPPPQDLQQRLYTRSGQTNPRTFFRRLLTQCDADVRPVTARGATHPYRRFYLKFAFDPPPITVVPFLCNDV